MADQALDILYPWHCPVCGEILKDRRALLCPVCREHLRPVASPRCFLCGRPVAEEAEYCPDCLKHRHYFDAGRGIFLYDSIMRKSLLAYKNAGHRQYAGFYAHAMATYAGRQILAWKPDMIVAVPIHPSRMRERGFNQAELIAKDLASATGIPFEPGLVIKRMRTKAQKTLSAGERRRNLADSLAVTSSLKGLNILVIDDIYTTGSTVDAMARCLKRAGALHVYFLTVCIVGSGG